MGRFFTAPRRFFSTTPGEGVETVFHDVPCPALAGMKLAFFSDIHASRSFTDAAMEALFARVAAMQADVVCIGGDFAEDEESLARLLRCFPLLSPPLGVYACPGNNDPEIPGFARMLSGHARLLVNESVLLEGLRLGGVDERKYGHPRPEAVFPHDGASARVLLAHYPVAYDFGAGARPDLQLCGHTHGGQFCVLGVSPYTFFFEPFSHAWISGECTLGGVRTIVSDGIGMSRVTLRVGAPPQVHCIRFTK